jgi:hypothetical protein
MKLLKFSTLVSQDIWQHISHNKFKRKMIILGQNKSLLQANKMKVLANSKKKKNNLNQFFISSDMFLHHKLDEGLNYFSAFKI